MNNLRHDQQKLAAGDLVRLRVTYPDTPFRQGMVVRVVESAPPNLTGHPQIFKKKIELLEQPMIEVHYTNLMPLSPLEKLALEAD